MTYLNDRYAIRYLDTFDYRVEAFKFYHTSCTYSDTVAFWYADYASPEDAVKAAKAWLNRGELERCPEGDDHLTWNLAVGTYSQPNPEVMKRGW